MDLISECALRVAKLVWRPGHGGFAYTVVCKATFELLPDVSPLAAAQEPVLEADVHTGTGGGLSLASDLVPLKKRPEVLVTGHAYAPEGRPVSSLMARLAVGEINKAIQVVGDRHFGIDGRPDDPAPFLRMPLAWERAAGGPDTVNPAGRPLGDAARADAASRLPSPNLLPPGLLPTARNNIVPPVNFGPIAPMWPSRAAFLHRHAAVWDPSRWQERPLPADIDLGYFNAAPPDQQRALPFGEEVLYLEHMHPRFAHLSTRLAPVTPVATVDHGSGPEPLQLRCDTLLIDTDRGLAMLVWRAHVVIDRLDRHGHVVVTGPPAPQDALGAWFDETSDAGATLMPGAFVPSLEVLPFSRAGVETPSSASPPATTGATASVAIEPARERRIAANSVQGIDPPVDETLTAGLVFPWPVLPFVSSQGEGALQSSAADPPFVPSPASESADEPPTERRLDSPVPPLFRATDAGWSSSPVEPVPRAGETPAPPPLLGPIATAPQGSSEMRDAERRQAVEGGAPVRPAKVTEREPLIAFDAYPPERCGAIAARLACDEGSTGDILRVEDLDGERWQRIHEHWLGRIRDEAARSRKGLLSAYDGAYVSALEANRGPIQLHDYARLAEAAERGAVARAFAERGLPEGAWPHIHRVWIGRMVKDARLGKQVRGAIDAVRAAG